MARRPVRSDFDAYVNTWIPAAFDNLKASLRGRGPGLDPDQHDDRQLRLDQRGVGQDSRPYRCQLGERLEQRRAVRAVQPVHAGQPDKHRLRGRSRPISTPWQASFGTSLEVFIGETGYSTDVTWGAANQATVYTEIFAWLNGQRSDGGKTVPLFFFDAFDRPDYPAGQIGFGDLRRERHLTADRSQAGSRQAVSRPGPTKADDQRHARNPRRSTGDDGRDTIKAEGGDDIVLGLGGATSCSGRRASTCSSAWRQGPTLRAARRMDMLDGGRGEDCPRRRQTGDDTLHGGKGDDVFVLAADGSTDTIVDFRGRARQVRSHATTSRSASSISSRPARTRRSRYDGEVIAVLLEADSGPPSTSGDFFLL